MVRRVGFHEPNTQGGGDDGAHSPDVVSDLDGAPKVRRDWYAIIFSSCWVIGWTLAIIAVAVLFSVFQYVRFWPGISITGFFFPVAIFVWIKGVMKLVHLLRNPNLTAR